MKQITSVKDPMQLEGNKT